MTLLTAAIVVVSTVASVGLFLLARRFAPGGSVFADGDRAAGILGLLATAFSVMLGFIVFLAFSSYDDARAGARAEATDVIQQFETAQLLPAPTARRLSGELVCYGRAVVGVEWPQLRHGLDPGFNPWGVALFRTIQAVHPGDATEEAAFAKWLDQTSEREQARLDRVQAGDGVIPSPLWIVLAVLGTLLLGYAFLFADPDERLIAQVGTVACVSAALVSSVLLVRFLDDPYRPGAGSLQPRDMIRVLGQMREAATILQIDFDPPCAPSGQESRT